MPEYWMTFFWILRLAVALLLAIVVYPYTLYPLALWLIHRLRPRPWRAGAFQPSLSVLIAAYNEEAMIRQKLQNTFELEYPEDRFEVIVVSDCSDDATDDIVRSFAPRAKLVRLPERSGKQIALNRAVEVAKGEILLFTDASVNLDSAVARELAGNFLDPRVGAVSSVIKITREGEDRFPVNEHLEANDAEGAYLGFDIQTRHYESTVYSAVGCCGSCYAIRHTCFSPFAPSACNDFASALEAVRRGYRVVVEPRAIGYMLPARTIAGEFRRKARTIAGGLGTLADRRLWPNITGHLLFWWSLFSHKVARWLGPIALLAAAALSVVGGVLGDRALLLLAILIGLPLIVGYLGLRFPSITSFKPIRLMSFAVIAITAAVEGWRMFLQKQVPATWKPTERIAQAQDG
jgi:cellulose synthase/poly-beta-1,6-N-acetylglucosamine synthase-like glycosyltransferase